MDFTNNFTVNAPLETVWTFMLNAEEVTPCVPGATLTESSDSTHHKGTVKVKLGAVQMTYRGELEMVPDEAARTIVLKAKGTDVRGGGGAAGTFHTSLSEEGGVTSVSIETRVDITGRVATFGRGIMQDVANRMLKDFAACLERKIQARSDANDAAAAGETSEPATTVETGPPPLAAPARTLAPATLEPRAGVPSPSWPPPPGRDRSASPPPSESNELKLAPLIATLARSRLAAGLRALAKLIEPK